MRLLIIVLALLAVFTVPSATYAVTADSNSWEGKYEGPTDPYLEGWQENASITAMFQPFTTTIRLVSYPLNMLGWYSKDDPNFNFSTGATLEYRSRMYTCTHGGAAAFVLADIGGICVVVQNWENKVSFWTVVGSLEVELGSYQFTTTGSYHIYRVVMEKGPGKLKLYIDGGASPVLEVTIPGTCLITNTIYWGDSTSKGDSDWRIDFIRYTNTGAYAPVGAPGFCGDAGHKYPIGDLDYDCVVNFKDFALTAQNWLLSTKP
jgi:hypothetical protein